MSAPAGRAANALKVPFGTLNALKVPFRAFNAAKGTFTACSPNRTQAKGGGNAQAG